MTESIREGPTGPKRPSVTRSPPPNSLIPAADAKRRPGRNPRDSKNPPVPRPHTGPARPRAGRSRRCYAASAPAARRAGPSRSRRTAAPSRPPAGRRRRGCSAARAGVGSRPWRGRRLAVQRDTLFRAQCRPGWIACGPSGSRLWRHARGVAKLGIALALGARDRRFESGRPDNCPRRDRVSCMSEHVLLLSWEYPPVIEGGLARHVRKLAEALVRRGVSVDVLTRGSGHGAEDLHRSDPNGRESRESREIRESPAGPLSVEERGGVTVYRVPEPGWPRDLDRFVAWVQQMNDDMLAAGVALANDCAYDLIHGHDWLVAHAASALSEQLEIPYATTIHATEPGRHQGWVQDEPQAHIHAVERAMAGRADAVIVCSYYMRGHVADIFDIDERRITVIPNGIDPGEMQPGGGLHPRRPEFAEPEHQLLLLIGRLVYEKGFQLALDALPGVIEREIGRAHV